MMANDQHEWCFKQIRDGYWTWFLTLQYSLQSQFHRPEWADTLFQMLIAEISSAHGNGSVISHIRVTQRMATGDVFFHVLLEGVPARTRDSWKDRWRELSKGTACDSPLGDAEVRFEQLVRELHCDIEASIGWYASVCPAGKNC